MSDYLNFAKKLALAAGEMMLEHFCLGIRVEYKADATPVTVADKAINSMVIKEINKQFPDHSIYGEEESDLKDNSEYLWVCDPIDGTYPYTLGVPCNAFSLALVKDGVPIVAVIYDPYLKRLLSASQGTGCFCNEQQIFVNSKSDLHQNLNILVEGSNSNLMHGLDYRKMLIEKYNARCARYYSVVYSSILVAAGTADAVIACLRTAHDIAAVKLIVEEAGGVVTSLSGCDQRYDSEIYGAIISNHALHKTLVEQIKDYLIV